MGRRALADREGQKRQVAAQSQHGAYNEMEQIAPV
jgi:hypothetical protein